MTNPPVAVPLDVEAARALLTDAARRLREHAQFGRIPCDCAEVAEQLTALSTFLAVRLPELGRDSERLEAISVPGARTRVCMSAAEVDIPCGPHASRGSRRATLREAIDAARSARVPLPADAEPTDAE